jgi:uncharacterized membrane protein (DUF4010 family)
MDRTASLLTPYLLSVVVSTGIGLIIGLEREFRKTIEEDHFAGIRTFPLVSLLGCLFTFMGMFLSIWIVVAGVLAFTGFVAVTYFIRSTKGHHGITTEISLIITFILGMMTSQQLIKEALAATVITTTLLTLKGQFHSLILKITEDELIAFVKFIILCLLLFPFLPDAAYGPKGLINPQEIGFVVVTVSAVSFVGYLLIKFTGAHHGILLTAFFGGMVSSTAVTWTFASKSAKSDAHQANLYAAGIILASSIMFVRVLLLGIIFNAAFATHLILPCVILFLFGLTFSIVLIKRTGKSQGNNAQMPLGNPTNILNALGFGLLYIGISYLVFYANEWLGSKGLILSGLISGLTDIDAITINITKFSRTSSDLNTLVTVILTATISNTLVKLLITIFQSSRAVKRKVGYALGTMVLVCLTYTLVILFL